ncbi:MAG TPA: glycosyltransferase family 2 protein [Candidatus Nanoarchaeia archaeon]|nr:glycosyltransferase family 2 protein [Candidatus Nanoarchaeia archaeon]
MMIVVTIPAYNEEKTIGALVGNIHKVMKEKRYSYKILVLDDGSSDKTAKAAKSAKAVVYSHAKNYGLAETFRTEIEKSLELGADVIVHIDADMQYQANEIPILINEINKGYDLVLGSRFLGKIEYMPMINRFGNKAFSDVVSGIAGIKISDAQTGFRAFTKDFAKKVIIRSDHTYTQEQIIRAAKNKFKIKEVPIYFAKRKDKSRLISNPFSYALKAWINILRIYRDYKPLKFFGVLGTLIFSFGILIGVYLIYLHLTTGIAGHLALMMLDVIILSIGFQLLTFALLADMFEGR